MASKVSKKNHSNDVSIYVKKCRTDFILKFLEKYLGPLRLAHDKEEDQKIYHAGTASSFIPIMITSNMDFNEPSITEIWINSSKTPWQNSLELAHNFSSETGKVVLCSPPEGNVLYSAIQELDTYLEISNGDEKIYSLKVD